MNKTKTKTIRVRHTISLKNLGNDNSNNYNITWVNIPVIPDSEDNADCSNYYHSPPAHDESKKLIIKLHVLHSSALLAFSFSSSLRCQINFKSHYKCVRMILNEDISLILYKLEIF